MATNVVPINRPKYVLPFGEKAKKFGNRWPADDKRINILEGSVRSAKTWAMIPKIIKLCKYNVGGQRVFFGVSKQTIYNNVLNDLFEVFGEKNYTYNRQSGELDLMGAKWLVIGAKDEGSEKYVRGLTVGVAVGDELVLIPPSFVKMLLNRMSPAGARFYATTNPDTPYHYVKTDLLDNKELIESGTLWTEHFTLDDNPNLDPEYRAYLDKLYKGVYHMRFVQGLWVIAEGSIYKDCWRDDLIYDDNTMPKRLRFPDGHGERYIACDYGTNHCMVFLDMLDDGKNIYIDREYVWDSEVEMRQKTDAEYADDLQEFLKLAPDAQVIIPPEAASFEAECVNRGLWLCDADNEVEDGIRITSSAMSLGIIRVHRRCERLIKAIPNYAWDPKAKARGVEKPLKIKDDEVDAMRYGIKTKLPAWRFSLVA